MSSMGLALVVGGLAFVVSGLIFLLPKPRLRGGRRETVQERRERIDTDLRAKRQERGDLS